MNVSPIEHTRAWHWVASNANHRDRLRHDCARTPHRNTLRDRPRREHSASSEPEHSAAACVRRVISSSSHSTPPSSPSSALCSALPPCGSSQPSSGRSRTEAEPSPSCESSVRHAWWSSSHRPPRPLRASCLPASLLSAALAAAATLTHGRLQTSASTDSVTQAHCALTEQLDATTDSRLTLLCALHSIHPQPPPALLSALSSAPPLLHSTAASRACRVPRAPLVVVVISSNGVMSLQIRIVRTTSVTLC